MKNLYIGSQSYKKNTGTNWKLYFYLILFFTIFGFTLKLTGSMIVEKWINGKGADANGYAFSVREVGISLGKGQLDLKDVKVFNKKTETEILESPDLTIQLSLSDFIMSQEKRLTINAEKVDLILSKDTASEIERIKADTTSQKNDFYLDLVEGKIAKLNIIEKKEDQSRTVIELNEVNLKIKDASLLSINQKTEFVITSKIADGGNLNLTGKTAMVNGKTPWSIKGTMKQVPSDIFNKIAGNKLPFAFNESTLNADITAETNNGQVEGEISPEIRKLNLVNEKPGVPTQMIARILTDELTFTLPFTLKNDLKLEYVDTFTRLKTYRKYPGATESSDVTEAKVTQSSAAPKTKKSFSFWPF